MSTMTTPTPPTTTPAPEEGFRFRDLGKMMGGGQSTSRQFGILGSLVVIIIIFQIESSKFLTAGNLRNKSGPFLVTVTPVSVARCGLVCRRRRP